MRIVFFDFITHFGGAPRATIELAARLAGEHEFVFVDPYGVCEPYAAAVRSAGFESQVLCPNEKRTTIGGSGSWIGRTLAMLRAAPGLLRVRRGLHAALRSLDADAIWTGSVKGAAVAGPARRGMNAKLIYHVRNSCSPERLAGRNGAILHDQADAIFSLADAISARLVASGFDESMVHLVPDCIDPRKTREAAARGLASPLDQADRPTRIVLPGTLDPRKGHATAIRALAGCISRGADAVLYLAGDTTGEHHQAYVQTLRGLAAELNVADRVVFLGWRNDLPAVIAASTVAVLPSDDEGTPLVILEAMTLDVPVISTPVGGIPDMIEHGRTGWLHEVGDDRALADCILRAHEAAVRSGVVADAHRHIDRNFSPARQRELAIKAFAAVRAAGRRR